jgi:2'-5' RNA ligase
MYGVISLLDEKHDRLVRMLWAELEEKAGLRGVLVTPVPHFSYHVAEEYIMPRLEKALGCMARKTPPFFVETTGLGIFTGVQPVLYLPIVRTLALSQFHRKLWRETAKTGAGVLNYYHPDHWMPHITIGYGDIAPEALSEAARLLSMRDLAWKIEVDNLALGYDDGTSQGIRVRVPLGETP